MRRLITAVGLAASLSGCTPQWSAHFEPRSVMVDTIPVVEQAVVLYADDVAIMRGIMSAQELGTVELDGTRMTPQQVNYYAARFAAKNGATHIVRVEHRNGKEYAGSTPVTVTMVGKTAYASGGQAQYRSTQSAVFLSFKVPVADWSQLPPALVPQLPATPVRSEVASPPPRPEPTPSLPTPTCATAFANLKDLADTFVLFNPGRQPVADLPERSTFYAVCARLPEPAQACLWQESVKKHGPNCEAITPTRDWLLMERLFLLPPAEAAAPAAIPSPRAADALIPQR